MSSTIWLTDRSRYESGLGFCPRARFLEYHFGPSGYGIRQAAGSMPQMRGIYIHEGCAILFAHLEAEDTLPGESTVRAAVEASWGKYEAVVAARGLRQLDHGDAIETIMAEQRALLTGMIWGLTLELLPWFHATYKVISVEVEETAVLGCTCGLGDLVGTVQEHEARDCQGVGWMSRADVIGEDRATGALAYFELKTTGQGGEMFETKWETSIQFAAGVLGAEARIGRKIDQSFVIGMFTGRREGTWNPETKKKDGARVQQSPFCYGYRKAAAAPGMQDEWAASWEWVDEQGRNRKLGPTYKKAPVWELPPALTGGVDPAEFWARWIPSEVRGKQFQLIGPLARQSAVLQGFQRQVAAHERDWQQRVWTLYEAAHDLAFEGQVTFSHPEYQEALDATVPCSWACRRYGKAHECSFADLCLRREGWDRPLETGKYMLRRPHHTPEILQAEARGIELPRDEGEEVE